MTALARFRAEKDASFRERPDLPFADATSGLSYHPASEAHVASLGVGLLKTNTGDEQPYFCSGRATFQTALTRFIANGHILFDSSYAYGTSYAYSARYRCPLPPAENRLMVLIYAGER